MPSTFPCPRCNRVLKKVGELCADGHTLPLARFQCDTCLGDLAIGRTNYQTAFTFVIDERGTALDQTTLKPLQVTGQAYCSAPSPRRSTAPPTPPS